MKQLVEAIAAFAETIGGPGLFLIAFLDSSFLSFPQANDLLVIWMVLKEPALMPYYAGMATLGSVAGCLVLHHLAMRGGEGFLKKRMRAHTVDRAMAQIQRHGVLAVIVPSILPPPAPFKLFVLLAGVAGVPRLKFAVAVALGRGFRYFGQGLLAVWYGEQAVAFLREHGRGVSLAVAVAVVIGAVAYFVWRRTRQGATAAAL
jgi:membrane protein YqaA with SNARE-associated domain